MNRRVSLSCGLLAALLVAGLLVSAPKPARAATPAAEDADLPARKILQRWIAAIGGAQEIAALKTVVYECKLDYGEKIPPIDLHVRSTAAGVYRCEMEFPGGGEFVQAFDGTVAWQQNLALGFGLQTPAEHQLNSMVTDIRVALRVGQRYPRRKVLPDETVGGRTCQVLEMAGDGVQLEKWFFDSATGYRVRVEFPGQGESQTIDYGDFRKAFGAPVVEPFRITRRGAGQKVELAVQSVLYNEPMDPGLFAVPPGRLQDNRDIERILFYNSQVMGLEATRRIQSRVTEQTVKVTTSGMTITSKAYNKRPNLLAVEQAVPGMGTTWRGYDGKVGWAWSEVEGYREMQGPELRQILSETDLSGPISLATQCPLRRLLGGEFTGGRSLVGIALASFQGTAGNFYFDEKTFELVRVETEVQAGPSGRLKIVAEYSDYRPVDGVMLPFHSVFTNPAMRMEVQVKSVQQNVPIDDALFVPRKE